MHSHLNTEVPYGIQDISKFCFSAKEVKMQFLVKITFSVVNLIDKDSLGFWIIFLYDIYILLIGIISSRLPSKRKVIKDDSKYLLEHFIAIYQFKRSKSTYRRRG